MFFFECVLRNIHYCIIKSAYSFLYLFFVPWLHKWTWPDKNYWTDLWSTSWFCNLYIKAFEKLKYISQIKIGLYMGYFLLSIRKGIDKKLRILLSLIFLYAIILNKWSSSFTKCYYYKGHLLNIINEMMKLTILYFKALDCLQKPERFVIDRENLCWYRLYFTISIRL